MSSELPGGWWQTKLGEVAALGGGTTPSRLEDGYWRGGAVPWATPSDITSMKAGVATISATESCVTARALAECSLPVHPPGTILMTSRATIGFAAMNVVPMTTNQGFITFRCGTKLNAEFLLQWLTAKRSDLVAAAGGSTFKELSRGTARLLPISLPPLDEQRRIAEVLRSVDDAIAATIASNEQAQLTLYGARATLLKPMAEATALGDVCEVIGGYAFKSTSFIENGVKVLRISNITEDGVDFSGRAVCVSQEDVSGLDRFRLKHLDTVVALSGATTGKMCAFSSDDIVYANQRVALIRVRTGLADQAYINHALSLLTASVRRSAYGGAQPNISTKEIAAMEIALPSLPEQRDIANVLNALSQAVALEYQALFAHRATKAVLLSDLLSGRVRVPA